MDVAKACRNFLTAVAVITAVEIHLWVHFSTLSGQLYIYKLKLFDSANSFTSDQWRHVFSMLDTYLQVRHYAVVSDLEAGHQHSQLSCLKLVWLSNILVNENADCAREKQVRESTLSTITCRVRSDIQRVDNRITVPYVCPHNSLWEWGSPCKTKPASCVATRLSPLGTP